MGIWGSYYIPKATFYLLKGDYKPKTLNSKGHLDLQNKMQRDVSEAELRVAIVAK